MRLPLIAVAVTLSACVPTTPPVPVELPILGGYRNDADQCRRVGESAYTNQFLDDSADLVACPVGVENLGVFVTETGAVQVDAVGGYALYSVPRG